MSNGETAFNYYRQRLKDILSMISTILWLLGFGGLILLVFAISEGIGEIFGFIFEVIGGGVYALLHYLLKPFHFIIKVIIVLGLVGGSFYWVYENCRWYWLVFLAIFWCAVFTEGANEM